MLYFLVPFLPYGNHFCSKMKNIFCHISALASKPMYVDLRVNHLLIHRLNFVISSAKQFSRVDGNIHDEK